MSCSLSSRCSGSVSLRSVGSWAPWLGVVDCSPFLGGVPVFFSRACWMKSESSRGAAGEIREASAASAGKSSSFFPPGSREAGSACQAAKAFPCRFGAPCGSSPASSRTSSCSGYFFVPFRSVIFSVSPSRRTSAPSARSRSSAISSSSPCREASTCSFSEGRTSGLGVGSSPSSRQRWLSTGRVLIPEL